MTTLRKQPEGTLRIDQIKAVTTDGQTLFQSEAPILALAGLLRNFIDGFTLSTDADSDHDIAFAPGSASDSTNVSVMASGATITKQIDAGWAEGDDAGGFPSGLTLAADTWYHCFVIGKTDGTVDAGFDTSLTATNLLADATAYTYYRRVGSVLTDASLNITPFFQIDDKFYWVVTAYDVNNSANGTTANLQVVSVPLGLQVVHLANWYLNDTTTEELIVTPPDANDVAPTTSNQTVRVSANAQLSLTRAETVTNTASQVRYRVSRSSAVVRCYTLGWVDFRGRNG